MDIDLPLLMNVEDISDFPDYPPNIVVNLTDPNPAWTLSLYGLTKEVVFKVSAHQTVQVCAYNESRAVYSDFWLLNSMHEPIHNYCHTFL